MEHLPVFAEVCVAYAGFISIFLIFARRDGRFEKYDSLRVESIFTASFMGVFMSVEALRDGEYLFPACRHAGHSQCVLVGLSTGVHEEHAVQSDGCNLRQLFGSLCTNIESHRVALEQKFAALLGDGFYQSWVAITECGYGVSAVQIQNSSTVFGEDIATAGTLRYERQLAVYRDRDIGFPNSRVR